MSEQQSEGLSERTVMIHGMEHTLLLNDEDAKRYEQQEESWKASREAAEVTREDSSDEAETKAKTPSNKAKGAQSK